MNELERLREDLARLEARLGDSERLAQTPRSVLDDERQVRNELRAKVEALEQAARAVPPEPGGLRSLDVGKWEPLVLHERQGGDERPPLEVVEVSGGEPDRAAIAAELASVLLTPNANRGPVLGALARWKDDAPILRLASAAAHSLYSPTEAERLGALPLHLPPARTVAAPPTLLLEGAADPVALDGLTEPQRHLLQVLRQLAPPERAFIRLSELCAELAAEGRARSLDELEREVLAVAHPVLRTFPVVELQGLSGRFTASPHFTHLRLSPIGAEVLDGRFPLPLLLVNGAEGRGWVFPSFSPPAVARALRLMLVGSTEHEVHDQLGSCDLPPGGVLHRDDDSDLRRSTWHSFRHRARIARLQDPTTQQVCLVIVEFPWPLRAVDVLRDLAELRAAGFLDGVTSVEDRSSLTEQRVVLMLEHVAFAEPVFEALVASKLTERRFSVKLEVGGQLTQLWKLLRASLEERERRVAAELRGLGAQARVAAQRAEAVVVALQLLEAVEQVLRDALDDAEAIAGLQRFMRPELRRALKELPREPSHDYRQGFTEAQARHLVGLRKLGRRRLDAALSDWARALEAIDAADARAKDGFVIRDQVLAELRDAEARFTMPRRTSLARW